jgi:hypothetical protein
MLSSQLRARQMLTPEQQQGLLSRLGQQGGQLVSDLLWAVDTPAAAVRSGLAYFQDGEWRNPLSDQRVYSEDLLDREGWEPGLSRFATGMALDIATDPLTWLTGGLTKAGRAAQATGLIGDASAIASRSLQKSALAAGKTSADMTGRAGRTLKALGNELHQFVEHSSRPLVGQRTALRNTTLDDFMKHAVQQDPRAKEALDAFLSKKGWNYADLQGQPLRKSFGIAGTGIAGDPLGETAGNVLASGLDRIGEAARWSKPGVLAHAYLNKAAGSAEDAVSQAAAIRINKAADAGQAKGNRIAADLAYDLRQTRIDPDVARRTGISSVFSPEAADALDRYIERVAATAKDIDLVENTPGLKAFVERWGNEASRLLRESADEGLMSHALDHNYGASYRPYQMETASGHHARTGKRKGAAFDLVTGDMLARSKSLQLPGGVDQLRALSQDKRFVGLGDKFVEDDVAKALFREINDPSSPYYASRQGSPASQWVANTDPNIPAMPEYSLAKSRSLARFLHNLPPDAGPVFGNHPAEAVARYVAGRERAIATSPEVVKSIASMVIDTPAGKVAGGRHMSAGAALTKLGLRSPKDAAGMRGGAAARLREAIAEGLSLKTGKQVAADSINLAEYSIDVDRVDRMLRMADLFASPKSKTQIGEFLDQYVKLFKAQVLTWPSRFTRDFMSDALLNLIEAGPSAAEWTWHGSNLLDGQIDKFLPALKRIPLYQNMPDEAALKAFMQDAAEHRVLGGLKVADTGGADRSGQLLQEILPGSKRVSLGGVFAGKEGRTWGEFGRGVSDIAGVRGVSWGNAGVKRADHTNPLFQAGERAGELTDSLNRLGGYLALMAQGVSPREAATRMRAAHIAYDSLSPFEKGLRDQVVPFWAYTSRIGKYVVEQFATRPGGAYAQTIRGLDKIQRDSDDTYIPQTMRERVGIPLSRELFGELAEPAPGQRRFVTNIDLPGMAAINLFSAVHDGDSLNVGASAMETARNITGTFAPHLQTAAKVMTGVDPFTKKPLGESPTALDTIAGGVTGNPDFRFSPAVNTALDLLMPGAGRLATAGRQLADPRIEDFGERATQTAINQVAPVRFAIVDEDRRRGDAIRQIDEMLGRSPASKTFETVSVNEEDFATLSPEMQQLVLLKRALEQQRRAEGKAKKRAERLRGGR